MGAKKRLLLCLHGSGQDGEIFSQRIARIVKLWKQQEQQRDHSEPHEVSLRASAALQRPRAGSHATCREILLYVTERL